MSEGYLHDRTVSARMQRNIDAVRDSVGRSRKNHWDDAVNWWESLDSL